MYGEVDNIKLGKTLFPNWRHVLSQNKYSGVIFTEKKIPWYRGRYDIILVVHFIIEFR